jgi:lipopolysaccharide transport system permease protein
LAPFALVAVGIIWFVSALGVYVHDLRQVVVLAAPVTMYLSPIFFPISSVPEAARPLFYANPLTFIIETIRGALFDGTWPNWGILALYAVLAWIFASLGYYWFVKIKPGFADVI